MSLENAHVEEYHLSVEELALCFSLINRPDIAGAMMKETFDQLTDEGLCERLVAASHSLLARQLATLNGQNIPLLDERLQWSLLPFMQHRAIGELAVSTGEAPRVIRMYFEGSRSFSAHHVEHGVIHHIFHGNQTQFIRWLVTQLPTLPPGTSSAASLGKIKINKLGMLMEVKPAQAEQFLKEAGVGDLTAHALAQDINGAQRISLVFTRVTERKKEQTAGGMLLLLGKQHNWFFPCAEFKEESLADIHQGGMEKLIALLQELIP